MLSLVAAQAKELDATKRATTIKQAQSYMADPNALRSGVPESRSSPRRATRSRAIRPRSHQIFRYWLLEKKG